MARARYAVDAEELFVKVIQGMMPDAEVRAEADVDAVEHLPLIIINPGQGQAIGNIKGVAWLWNTSFAVLAGSDEEASDVSDELYEKLSKISDSWDPTVGMIAGVGAINKIEDISIFSRTATSVTPAGGLTQYDGTFAITVRKI
jgi:hypothetical protein